MTDAPAWAPQLVLPPRPAAVPGDAAGWTTALGIELAAAIPYWHVAQRRFSRTTVGNSRLAPDAWAPFATQFLTSDLPESAIQGVSPAALVRYVADDLKALYLEAAQAAGSSPSSAQINRWFWNQTLAADFLRALRCAAMTSQHSGFNTVGSRFLVPAPYVARS
jgi:hypothetical protein